MLNILDGTMIVFAVLMLIGGWYVYKLARLSEAWQSMWIYFGLFLLFLPGSRIVNGILYETCPSTSLGYFLRIVCPAIGGMFFVLAFQKLYKMFSTYLRKNGFRSEGK